MVRRAETGQAVSSMATLLRIPARIQAATRHVSSNLVICWFAGAILSLDVLSRGIVGA
jgi:hypothetical protein